ncbi:MAG: DEAD/DEAH box helicase [Erysipelotrichaceae bacterium]|nr:DEAD/DEAH box helicase [Erysipelotrichaceae bacterium]
MLFKELNIITAIQKALEDEGYQQPTPIQAQAIEPLLAGSDLIGCAQTGTGKTAAYAIPILQGINNTQAYDHTIKALVLAPTRELAIQINESFKSYGKYLTVKSIVIYGGVSQGSQTRALAKRVDVLVATPGRLLDLINQKFVDLSHIRYFVLDEADQMLDMGMIQDVKKIIGYIPQVRQTMLFSATMPSAIEKLSETILNKPIKVAVTPVSSTVDTIKQELYYVNQNKKINLLADLLKNPLLASVLVFSRTKHGADKIVKALKAEGYPSVAIHGNKSQNARQAALNDFKNKRIRILVATDIAARGLDIDELSHVILYDLPEVPEIYVHRIGRTGRAGLSGTAISFCDQDEKGLLKEIQRLIKQNINVIENHPYPITDAPSPAKSKRGGPQRPREFTNTPKPKAKSNHGSYDQTRSARPKAKPVSIENDNWTGNTFAGSKVIGGDYQHSDRRFDKPKADNEKNQHWKKDSGSKRSSSQYR